ncbi:hypothetical protein OE88DRAFT_1667683 [Heliocybe sulcata]|uniref:Uncharacterized protein n=1 Tax=Heliocybe sulcata TaxID=5364 RepID=A0A5C3MNQ5_9AGAM|nr:hypothetical protein OE88DRAFT_1667683 [Heliocybe sulcata]
MPGIITADQLSGAVDARPKVTKTYSGRRRTIAPQPETEQLPGQETFVLPSLLDGSNLNPMAPVRGSRGALMLGDLDDMPGSVISESIGKLHNALRKELYDMWVEVGDELLGKLNVMGRSTLSAFFATPCGYNTTTRRWESIPVNPKREKAIYEPLYAAHRSRKRVVPSMNIIAGLRISNPSIREIYSK